MKPICLLFSLLFVLHAAPVAAQKQAGIMLLGCDHLAQIYNPDHPATDVLRPEGQKQITLFADAAARFQPDRILVERLPEEQGRIDSLYALYTAGRLRVEDLPDGRSEVFQVAFRMARGLGHERVYCVDAPGGTSQGLLDNGDHIELYQQEGVALRALVQEQQAALRAGKISLFDYLRFINNPDTYNRVYHVRYITPARVTNGVFRRRDPMVDSAFINPKYIGAELTSVFKNRDYKIYSNIVTTRMKAGGDRLLLVIGAAHLGSLRSIFRDDPEYRLRDAIRYLR